MRALFATCFLVMLSVLVAACGGGTSDGSITPFDVASAVVVADLNNDGVPDFAVATTHVAGAPPHAGFAAVVLRGATTTEVHYATGPDPAAIAVGDLNGDGFADLLVYSANVVAGAPSMESVSVLYGDPTNPGTFQTRVPLAAGGTANSPRSVAIGDLNGDGKPDVAVATGLDLVIFFQDPANAGQFLPAPLHLGISATSSVAIGDLNGDGVPDLAVTTSAGVSVFFQSAGTPGTFPTRVDVLAGIQPYTVQVADLNGDGLTDLVVADLGGGGSGVTILLQDPAHHGAFLAGTFLSIPGFAVDVAIAHLDGDGKPDLVVALQFGAFAVVKQNPTGTFTARTASVPFPIVSSVAIADVDGDGKPDIILAAGPHAVVYLQTATGGFTPA